MVCNAEGQPSVRTVTPGPHSGPYVASRGESIRVSYGLVMTVGWRTFEVTGLAGQRS